MVGLGTFHRISGTHQGECIMGWNLRTAKLVAATVVVAASSPWAAFGIGANLGKPTGLNLRVGQQRSVEGILNWGLEGQEHVELIGNILFHGQSLGRESPITGIYPHAGIGLGFWSDGNQGAWIQVPLGIDMRFWLPIELWLHVDPGMDIVPKTGFTIHWGLGIRYWFK